MIAIRSRDLRPYLQKPPPGARINRDHQLGRGLVNCFIMAEGSGGGTYDAAGGLRGTFVSGPVWVPANPAYFGTGLYNASAKEVGPCIDFPAGGSAYIDIVQPDDAPYLGDCTLVWRGVIRSGNNYRDFVSKHAGGGGTNSPFDFRTDNSANPVVTLVRANGAGNNSWAESGGATPNQGWITHAVSFQAALDGTVKFYFGGRLAASSQTGGTQTGLATGTGANIRIGRRADGAVQMDGVCVYVSIYNRILTADEHLWLQEEPFCMFSPLTQTLVYKVPAVSAGRSFGVIIG